MKLTTMLQDLTRSLFSKPATEKYPAVKPKDPERLRGALHWSHENCTGCQLCVKDCPADALKLVVLDKKNKKFAMCYDIGRCTFCGQCVENCRFDCIELMNNEWALANTSRAPFSIYFKGEEEASDGLAEDITGDSIAE